MNWHICVDYFVGLGGGDTMTADSSNSLTVANIATVAIFFIKEDSPEIKMETV